MKTVEDAVRDLGGVWPSYDRDRCYLWWIGDDQYQALNSDRGFAVKYVCTRDEFEACKEKLKECKSMKLIDILARELDEWPEGVERITQDSHGELNRIIPGKHPEIDERLGTWKYCCARFAEGPDGEKLTAPVADDHATAIITREQWEEARRGLESAEGGIDWPPPRGSLLVNSKTKERMLFDGDKWHELPEGWEVLPDPDFAPEWRGPQDGLPPAGIMCEAYDYDRSKWWKCQTLDAETGSGERACVTLNDGGNFSMLFWGVDFRPLTLKSDRDRWIEQMQGVARNHHHAVRLEVNGNGTTYSVSDTQIDEAFLKAAWDAGLGRLKEEE